LGKRKKRNMNDTSGFWTMLMWASILAGGVYVGSHLLLAAMR
jgi:hypothetical protein